MAALYGDWTVHRRVQKVAVIIVTVTVTLSCVSRLPPHHSVQIATTLPIPTKNNTVLPGIIHDFGKPIILLVKLKRKESITTSLLESWHTCLLKACYHSLPVVAT